MLIRWMRIRHQRSGSHGANMTNDCIALGWAHGHEREIHARFMHALFQVVSEGLGTVVQGPWQF